MKKIFIIFSLILCIYVTTNVHAASYQMHTIEDGDTYYKIANSNGTSVDSLEKINYQESRYLKKGDLIKIKEINTIKVNINGSTIKFERDPYIENERVFVPIRFITEAFEVDEIDWVQESKTAVIKKDDKEIKLTIGSSIAYINQKPVELGAPAQLYIDTTFVPVRFISEAFGVAKIEWDNESHTVIIKKDIIENTKEDVAQGEKNSKQSNEIQDKSESYTEEDVYWLSRIINCEAKYEPYEGKIGVANTIINRTKSPSFPSTIKGVIFDTKYGVQFPPTQNGQIYNVPSEECINAAIDALEGNNNVGNSIYFVNPKTAQGSWVTKNRTYYNTISNHDFYL